MADLQIIEPWPVRAGRLIARAFGLTPVERPESAPLSGDIAAGVDSRAVYDPRASMSAYAAFAWVFAAAMAVASDSSSRPWALSKGRGRKAERVDEHSVLDLLERPGSRTLGAELWPQIEIDRLLCGNAYCLILFGANGEPVGLRRLHPARVSVTLTPDGQIDTYVYDGAGQRTAYLWSAVLHWRGPSWVDDPRVVLGTGRVEALHRELSAELALSMRATKAAQQGKPDAIASPAAAPDKGGVWGPKQVAEFAETIRRAAQSADGGIMVLGGQAKIDVLSWSPKDMDLPGLRALTREAVLAVFGVPPTRLQLPTANYAQSTDAMTQYWTNIRTDAGLFCNVLNARLIPLFRNAAGLTVARGFEDVTYLQSERSARLQRVSAHILNGMSPPDAYAYEGFDDAPIEAAPPPAPEPPAPRQIERAEDPRGDLWRGWIARSQAPGEAALRKVAGAYLATARGRVVAAVKGDDPAAAVGAVLDGEVSRLTGALGAPLRALVLRGWDEAAGVLDGIGAADTTGIAAHVSAAAGAINATTRAEVIAAIKAGLKAGDTAETLATRIAGLGAWSPARAQLVARTESTRALNEGAVLACKRAEAIGLSVKKQWLSARDGSVRPSHRALDGQVRAAGVPFVVPAGVSGAGNKAAYPGAFSDPGEICNCRCTLIPVVE